MARYEQSPNGTWFKLTVGNDGIPVSTQLSSAPSVADPVSPLMRDSNGNYWTLGVDASGGEGNEAPVLIPVDTPEAASFSATDVDICNMALSHLGDTAEVETLDDATPQAQHCKRFYPSARNALLEMHAWSFATLRVNLQAATYNPSNYAFAYQIPIGALRLLAVLMPGSEESQTFACEDDGTGNMVLVTDVESAILKYTRIPPLAESFTPLFQQALSWLLASMLAGPIIKGDVGQAEAQRCLAQFRLLLAQATTSDANKGRVTLNHTPSWMSGR